MKHIDQSEVDEDGMFFCIYALEKGYKTVYLCQLKMVNGLFKPFQISHMVSEKYDDNDEMPYEIFENGEEDFINFLDYDLLFRLTDEEVLNHILVEKI